MARRDTDTDDPRVKVRPGRGSRPRTEWRPSHTDVVLGTVTRIDRGHYRIHLDNPGLTKDSSGNITAMRARELRRGKVVVGDRVAVVGDTSGHKGTLAHMVRIKGRTTLLRHSAEDGNAADTERPIAADAAKLVIVTAVAGPEPRPHMIGRYLVAVYDAGTEPLIVLTRGDLTGATPLTGLYSPLGVRCPTTRLSPRGPETDPSQAGDERPGDGVGAVRQVLDDTVSVLVGHSGVGKSMPINTLVPGADRAIGHVNEATSRGRYTSTSLQALELPGGGWVIDTPGVRSFGVSHVDNADVLKDFPDLARVAENCPRGYIHEDGVVDCALDEWASATDGPGASRASTVRGERCVRMESFRRLLASSPEAEDPTCS